MLTHRIYASFGPSDSSKAAQWQIRIGARSGAQQTTQDGNQEEEKKDRIQDGTLEKEEEEEFRMALRMELRRRRRRRRMEGGGEGWRKGTWLSNCWKDWGTEQEQTWEEDPETGAWSSTSDKDSKRKDWMRKRRRRSNANAMERAGSFVVAGNLFWLNVAKDFFNLSWLNAPKVVSLSRSVGLVAKDFFSVPKEWPQELL